MSKISQAKKELKKKLSFNDYSTPSDQYDGTQEDQHPVIPTVKQNSKSSNLHVSNTASSDSGSDIIPAKQSAGMPSPVEQHDSAQVHHKDSMSHKPAGKHDGAAAYHQSAHAGKEVQKQKVKATYYLSQQELEMVTHLYIKQLRKHNKGDKSAIICDAIRLIYERDKYLKNKEENTVKKTLLAITFLFAAPVFGVVWENDPSYTPEQRQRAREHNERMAQRNSERMAEKKRQLDTLSQKYKDVVENVKKRHKENPDFQEALAIAELEVVSRYDPEVQKYRKVQRKQINWVDLAKEYLKKYDVELNKKN